MKKIILLLSVLAMSLSSCKVYNAVKDHSSVELITPKTVTEPVTLVFKLWGAADMLSSFIPPNSKFGKFVTTSEEYCTFRITQYASDGNDTTELTIKCKNDSITKQLAAWAGKRSSEPTP